MAGVMDTLISGIVKSAMNEILKKSGVKASATKRTKRKTRSSTSLTPPSNRSRSRKAGPVTGTSGRGARAVNAAKKQVSKRRTSAARSKAKRR